MATVPQAALALKNILIATDFSPCSDRALLHAVAVAHRLGSTLHMVHVVPPALFSLLPPDAYMNSPELQNAAADQARDQTEQKIAAVLRDSHCEEVKHKTWVQLGAVGEMIRVLIDREHIDLAILGTHGKTGLRRIIMGSVAEEIFRNAPCPVLTVGPHSWRSDPQTVHLRHILFPTDLTPASASALPLVIAIANNFNARLTMLHIVERMEADAELDRLRVINAIEQQMQEMVWEYGPVNAGAEFRVQFGDVASSVIDAASRLEVDLVAFGLKAPDTYTDRLPWMHAYKIVCEVACPVLSLRGESAGD